MTHYKKILGVALIGMMTIGLARADIILSTFDSSGFQWSYGSWNPLTSVETQTPTYLSIAGAATESGGAGISFAQPVSFDPTQYLVSVTARIGSGNVASGFNVILQTSPTDSWGYYFPAASFNPSTFTTVSIAVTNPTFVNGSPNFSGSGMTDWQIQGDFSSTDALRFDFEDARLSLVPEPSTLALLALGVVSFLARSVRNKGA